MHNTNNLFKKILGREASPQEISRYTNMPEEAIIDDLSFCEEKYRSLLSRAGELIKTNVNYSDQDILDFFSTKNFKVAICLSGHLRDYSTNLPAINKFLIEPLNADVFIHTWDSVGKQVINSAGNVGPTPDETIKVEEKSLSFLKNIKRIKIEKNSDFLTSVDKELQDKMFYLYGEKISSDRFGGSAEPRYIYSQFYSIYQSYKLLEEFSIENHIKYDLVIKLRSDYKLTSGIPVEDIEAIKKNKEIIFVPTLPYSNHGHPSCCICLNDINHTNKGHVEDVCDVFAYSSFENMKKYMSVFENLENIRQEMNRENEKMLISKKYELVEFKKFRLVNIWRKINYDLNCFYPERIFRFLLKENILKPSKLSGLVVR